MNIIQLFIDKSNFSKQDTTETFLKIKNNSKSLYFKNDSKYN